MKIVSSIPLLALLALLALPISETWALGAGITYHGRLIDPSGAAVVGSNVQFKIQLRTPGNENCLLYEEVQSKDLSQTEGIFSLTINDGSGTRLDSSGYNLDQIFANRGSYNFSSGQCTTGTSYNTNPTDGRKIQVLFNDGTFAGGTWEAAPAVAINFIPMAIESMQIGGYKPGQLLKIADGVSTTGTELNNASWTELLALIGGSSTQYAKTAGTVFTAAPQWAGVPSTGNDLVNKTYLDSQIAAGLPNIGTAGTYTKVTTDAKGRVTSGTTLSESDIPTLSTAGKVSGAAINAGTIAGSASINSSGNLVTTGTVQGSIVSGTNLRAYSGANYVQLSAPGSLSGIVNFTLPAIDGASGTLMKTNGSGQLSFAALGAADIPALDTGKLTTGTLPVTRGGTGTATLGISSVLVSNATGSAISSLNCASGEVIKFDVLGAAGCGTDTTGSGSQWTTSSSDIYYTTGNVGIGTTAPGTKLTVRGSANGAMFSLENPGGTNVFQAGTDSTGANQPYLKLTKTDGTALLGGYGDPNVGPHLFSAAADLNKPDGGQAGWGAGLAIRTPYLVNQENGIFFINGPDFSALAGGAITFYTSDTSNYGRGGLKFKTTDSGSVTTRMTIDPTGNVGIGTTAPLAKLHVVTSASGNNISSTVYSSSSSWDAGTFLGTRARGTEGAPTYPLSGDRIASFSSSNAVNSNAWSFMGMFATENWSSGAQGTAIRFYTLPNGGTTSFPRMSIDNNGNIGIGTATPSVNLDVVGTAGGIRYQRGGGSTIVQMTDYGGSSPMLYMSGVDNSVSTFLNSRGPLKIYTGGADPGTSTMAMTISGGNVGIGTTSPQTTLQVEGVISPATNNTYTLGNATYRFTEVYATNGVINTSDRREKKDIANTDLGLDFVNKLRPVSYRWNTGVDSEVHYGLIAQEAEQVLADLGKKEETSIVTHDSATDRYGVRYSELISPLIKAIQELYGSFLALQTQHTAQDREIASVKEEKADRVEVHQLKIENEKLKHQNAIQAQEMAELKSYLCRNDKNTPFCKKNETPE